MTHDFGADARQQRRVGSAGFITVTLAMLWLATAIASVAFWPIYQSPALIVLVVAATVLGSAIAVLGALFRWSSAVCLAVAIAVYLLAGVPLAVPDRALSGVLPTADGLLDLIAGTALSWKQLLTVSLPVGSYQTLLVPAFILVFGTVTVSGSVALRAKRSELAVLGPIVLFLAAIALGSTRATLPLELSLGLTAAILLWLLWRRAYRRLESLRLLSGEHALTARSRDHQLISVRTLLGAALTMALAAGTAVAASAMVPPSGSRDVLRTAVVQPFDPRDYVSPLSGFRMYEQASHASRTMFTVSGLPQGARIRIATLDSYNGIVYSVGSDRQNSASGSFTRVPAAFDQSEVSGQHVTVEVTIDGYRGVWVPTVGKFERIQFSGTGAADLRDSFYYNDTSGTAAVVAPLGEGSRYQLHAVLPTAPTAEQLSGLTPGSEQSPQPSLIPDELSNTLDRYVRDITSPGDRLVAMIDALKSNGYLSHAVAPDDPPSRSGHAADRITQLLTDQRMIGDQEQYAVTAALMAQELGFPARVVFGFEPSSGSSGPVTVRGGDVSAWIEVGTAQFGWVALDTTPPEREIPPETPQAPAQVARPQSPVQPPQQAKDTHSVQTPPESTQEQTPAPDPLLQALLVALQVVGWLALGSAVVLAPFLTIVAAKARRRALRRKASTPIERISGGWREFEDAVVDHGFLPPPSPTRTEVAALTGGMRSLMLASVADRAVFAPETSQAREADQVWRTVGELRGELERGLTRWQRIKARISVRSLGGYSVKRLFKRQGDRQ
ncbi:transglutaminase-like domain-containing protein [Parafrigoribacterium mesophilum]|uniref:transglutaminase-like domain-containing protein n=1 Tax=Parafrigoribacterium mesophilum TaxID=433646 RepID=UPI0031FBD97B